VVVDGETFPLMIPSGTQSGIKLNHGFELTEGTLTSITLDFDAGESVHYTPGNGWMMRPVIDVIATTSEPMPEEPVDAGESDSGDGPDGGDADGGNGPDGGQGPDPG